MQIADPGPRTPSTIPVRELQMTIDTNPELEAEAARVLGMILHESAPIPVWVAFDMLMDAGCEDRSDVSYLLFRATGDRLLMELGRAIDSAATVAEVPLIEMIEWEMLYMGLDQANRIAHAIRGQGIPNDRLIEEMKVTRSGIRGLGNHGTNLRRIATLIYEYASRLPRIITMLREVEQIEAEELKAKAEVTLDKMSL